MQATATPAADWVIILPVILPLVAAALLVMLRPVREFYWLAATVVALAVLAIDVELFRRALVSGPVSMTMGNWMPPFGISFTADAMGAGFAATAAFVTALVILYTQGEAKSARPSAFYPLALLLLAGVTGAFLTGDLFNLYVWFEVMLIASFGLMVQGSKPLQLDGTVKYGFLNFLATVFFLLALGQLYGALGTLNMADIMRVAPAANGAVMAGIAALLLLAFGMKAAAFPVNAWLPASYHTPPAAISALLAGLLTKVGVYALLRSLVMLLPASREILEPVLALLAVLTLVIAPLGAIAETNLRRALGFMVIGGIGAAMLGIAMPNANGLAGSAAYIFHAMLTMTGLYLAAGLIESVTGAVDTRRMGGLYAAHGPLSIVFVILVMAIAGVPPFLGFWPKLLLLEGGLDASGLAVGEVHWPPLLLSAALLLNALLTLIAGIRLWSHVFWRAGHEGEMSETPNPDLRPLSKRQASFGFGATAAMALAVILLGLLPGTILELGRSAAVDLLNPEPYSVATGRLETMP